MEKQNRAAATRKIFRKAKGWMLIKTILAVVFIAPDMPRLRTVSGSPVSAAVRNSPRVRARLVQLFSCERTRESQILLRFGEVGLNAQGHFVVVDGGLIFSILSKQIRQFLMCDLKIGIQ